MRLGVFGPPAPVKGGKPLELPEKGSSANRNQALFAA
jgi:hypothetical protein